MSIKQTNAALAKAGKPVTLVRGEGYHYFVYDTMGDPGTPGHNPNGIFETCSVMTVYYSQQPKAQWLAEGLAFAQSVEDGTFDSAAHASFAQ